MPCAVGSQRSAPGGAVVAAVWLFTASWPGLGCYSASAVAPDGSVTVMDAGSDAGRLEPADECFWGAQFADCGGTGTPRFACQPAGLACRWFTGGVVAEGYLAWPCADGRICCEEGEGASYPHDLSISPASFFNINGAAPWTRELSLALDVSVDAQLAGDLLVECVRDGSVVDDVSPCRVPGTGPSEFMNRLQVYAEMNDTLSVSVIQTDGFSGRRIQVEIVPGDSPATTLARACLLGQNDGVPISCDPADYQTAHCATAGSVRLSAIPTRNETDLAGVVVGGDAVFADGLEVSFTVPL